MMEVGVAVWEDAMLGTTEPTLGTGEEMRGDMEGMAASWDRRVTSVVMGTPSPGLSLSPATKRKAMHSVLSPPSLPPTSA